jgi:hypothetical protein
MMSFRRLLFLCVIGAGAVFFACTWLMNYVAAGIR